ncbi:MAG: DMT family transporter [Chloroflexia bacterium]|nr:DMT family transporter [Chloroflexia bacterium]
MQTGDRLALLLLGALWGGGFLFVRIAVPDFGPFALVNLRVLLAGVLMLAWAAARGGVPPFWLRWRDYLILSALNVAAPFTLSAWAVITVPASLAAIVMATIPFFTAVLMALRLRVWPTARQILGLLVGFAGVAILTGLGPIPLTPAVLASIAALLASAFFYALGGIFTARRFAGVSPVESTIGQQFGAFVLLVPFALAVPPREAPSTPAIASLLLLALLGTVVAYLLFFRLISSVGPTRTATVAYLIPLFGTAWGALLLGEPVGPATVLGMATILAGVVLVTGMRLAIPGRRFVPVNSREAGGRRSDVGRPT